MLNELWTVGVLPIVVMGLAGWYATYRVYRFMAAGPGTKAVVALLILITLAELVWAAAYVTMAPVLLAVAMVFCTAVLAVVAGLSAGLSTVMSLNYFRVRSGRAKGLQLLMSGVIVALSCVILWVYLYRKFAP